MKVAIGADHGGYEIKSEIARLVGSLGHQVADLGAHELDSDDDYPDLAAPVARSVQNGEADRGIVICGSGIGASITASKFRGVRASVCHDTYSAAQGVEHDDMNVLCLGARVIGIAPAQQIVTAFLGAKLDHHPRFRRRLDKLSRIEDEQMPATT
jgi:ribose 5-phosphate isomerase B